MLEDMSNKTFARLLGIIIALVASIGLVWVSWPYLGTVARWVGIALVGVVALVGVFLVIRAWQEVKKHQEAIEAAKTTRLIQADEHTKKWDLEELRTKQEHERLMRELDHRAWLESQRFTLEQHLAMTRVLPTEHGYAALIERDAQQGYTTVTQIPYAGKPIAAHAQERITDPQGQAIAGKGLPETRVYEQPTQDYILSQLKRNALEVSPGLDAKTGELRFMKIEDAVHFKLIGSSGFGKSCLAGSLLDQATQLNSPDKLQIALLDLEHKTSRMFEDLPHVVEYKAAGGRRIPLASKDADEVAVHFGYLVKILNYRASLSEYDLEQQPIILMYVEEMLSLQYEVVDPAALKQMLADLSILALRARKYRMFLLACAQTDYSTDELKAAQKQFRSRIAFAVDTTAARAAGFMNTDLIKHNFATAQKGDGHFVLEYPGYAGICIAPTFDVRAFLLDRSTPVQEAFTQPNLRIVESDSTPVAPSQNATENGQEPATEAIPADIAQVLYWHDLNWGKQAIIEKVYGVKKGGSQKYQAAVARYEDIMQRYGRLEHSTETETEEEGA